VLRFDLINQALQSIVTVEVVKYLCRVKPGTVHPEMLDDLLFHYADQAACMIVVCMRYHHMTDVISGIERVDVADNGVACFCAATVDKVQPVAGRCLSVTNNDRIPRAFTDRKKVNFVNHGLPWLLH